MAYAIGNIKPCIRQRFIIQYILFGLSKLMDLYKRGSSYKGHNAHIKFFRNLDIDILYGLWFDFHNRNDKINYA